MRIVENNIIPFPDFGAINLFGEVFVREEWWDGLSPWSKKRTIIHESIHQAQMRELLYVGFYILYFFEWIYQIIVPPKGAYRWISFEREAFIHENDEEYLDNRKYFAQWREDR